MSTHLCSEDKEMVKRVKVNSEDRNDDWFVKRYPEGVGVDGL